MTRCKVDSSVGRVEIDGFQFPLGVYPVEDMTPRPGYTLAFEPADGGEGEATGAGGLGGGAGEEEDEKGGRERSEEEILGGGGMLGPEGAGAEWEEWPDRYVFDILISANRVESLCRALFALLPGRFYPILDVLGHDEYREVDPYVSYDLLGMDRFIDSIRRYRGFFYEDGLVGFGAMSEDPFLYIFVDEHKIVTVRAEVPMREKIEQVLAAFDLEQVDQIAGADSVTHEHRSVLDTPDDRLDLLTPDEIVEELQDGWHLELNINPDTNVDEEGAALGTTGWRVIVRVDPPDAEAPEVEEDEDEAEGASPGPKAPAKARAEKPGAGEAGPKKSSAKTPANGDQSSEVGVKAGTPAGAQALAATRYAEVLLSAESLRTAQDLAIQAVTDLLLAQNEMEGEPYVDVLTSDRLRPESFTSAVKEAGKGKASVDESRVWHAGWLG